MQKDDLTALMIETWPAAPVALPACWRGGEPVALAKVHGRRPMVIIRVVGERTRIAPKGGPSWLGLRFVLGRPLAVAENAAHNCRTIRDDGGNLAGGRRDEPGVRYRAVAGGDVATRSEP